MSRKKDSKMDKKKELFKEEKKERRASKKYILLFVIIAIFTIAGGGYYLRNGKKAESFDTLSKTSATTEQYTIPLQSISEEAKYFKTVVSGVPVRFFVMKSSDGIIRSAFDACDTCAYTMKGYHQEGDNMVCNNCGQMFPSEKINIVKGGCNPAPLDNRVEGNEVRIRVADIMAGVSYFNYRR